MGRVTLDTVLPASFAPDVVKIDIEGAELLALRGARKLLAHQPALLIEVSDKNRDEVTALLRTHGYRLFDAADPRNGFVPVGDCRLGDSGNRRGAAAPWGGSERSACGTCGAILYMPPACIMTD